MAEGTDGGIIDRRANDSSMIIKERRGDRVNRRLFIINDVRCFRLEVGHDFSHLALGQVMGTMVEKSRVMRPRTGS